MNEFYVRYVELPYTVKAVTIPNTEGDFDIYINSTLDEVQQHKALTHEIKHIKKDHFYTDTKPIEVVEDEAG